MAIKRTRLDKKALLALSAVLGVEVVVCGGILMSLHNRKNALEMTLHGKEAALQNVRTVSAGLPGLTSQYQKMTDQVRFLERGLPPPEYTPTLLGQIEQTARNSHVLIAEFRPKAAPVAAAGAVAAPTAGPTQQSFDMTVQGTYGQMQAFLGNLTRFRKILSLTGLTMKPSADAKAAASPVLSGTLNFTAFALPPEAAPLGSKPADAAPAPGSVASAATGATQG